MIVLAAVPLILAVSTVATPIILSAPLASPVSISVDATRKTHTVNKHFLGCHSDSGYTHQPRGFYSQMIVDASFEDDSHVSSKSGWIDVIPATATATIAADNSTAMNGGASRKITYTKGSGTVGLANRGLGNEGLLIEGSSTYAGYFFAKGDKPVSLEVSLETTAGEKLASQTIDFHGGDWTQINFSLTTGKAGTDCVGIKPGSDPSIDCGKMGPGAGHVCVSCGGQFKVGLASPGAVNLDFIFLNPPQEKLYKGLLRPGFPPLV